LEGEGFVDLNQNGVWDKGDYLNDKNGNGKFDQYLESRINNSTPEPYTDGDIVVGEPFTDLNGNGVYDAGVDLFIRSINEDNMDLNHDGFYNGPDDVWQDGIPFIDLNGNGLYDYPDGKYNTGEPFVDQNDNGKWDAGGSNNFFDPNTFDESSTWHNRKVETIRGELKFFWQLGNHELKIGGALQKEDLLYQEIDQPYLQYTGRPDGGPYSDRGSFRDMFSYDPWGGTFYFRDKLEYGSMIASLGFRWDFFIQDKYDLVEVARNDDLGSGIILGDRQKFSPRIGFSYPISDKAKVHFNYGHFFQRPALTYMYQRNTASVSFNTTIGNYNLDYMKTIQYSFGVKYAMTESYSLDISGYFKDEFDKINPASVRVGGLTRQQYRNRDYGRSRGFEFQVDKQGGGYVNGLISYTYAFAYGKASQTNEDYLTDFQLSRDPLDEAPLDNDVRHSLKASVQVYIPSTVKPKLFGLPIPNGWSMDLQTFIESGRPFTPTASYPNINTEIGENIQRNSLRKPSIVNFDVRFSKDFKIFGLDNKFILWVENIFDNKNINNVYTSTGRPDTQQNESGVINGGTEYDNNPNNYDYGRQIRMGIELNL
ncbi:MAG: TonB-dependent receptor, partial [Calditrichaeota bacterium]